MSQSPSLKDPSALACTPIPDKPSDLTRPAHHWDPLDRHNRSHCPVASKHTFLRYYWQKTSIQKRQKIIQKYEDISQEFWGCGSPQKPEILTWNPHHLSHTHTTKALRENRRFKSYRLLTGLWTSTVDWYDPVVPACAAGTLLQAWLVVPTVNEPRKLTRVEKNLKDNILTME